jgi:NADPH:quinone reductase-like Zn-dependent oxidoreductase
MLEFQMPAKVAFVFLEQELGFKLHLVAQGLLRYETKDVFVVVSYDAQRSLELSLSLGRKNATVERAFNFGEVLRSMKAPEDVASAYQVTSGEALNQFLNKLAENLQQYGVGLLQNDAAAFARLAQLRERECDQYAFDRDIRSARGEAETAWRKKDYSAVVKALKPFRADLTAAEVGKLDFAEKQFKP